MNVTVNGEPVELGRGCGRLRRGAARERDDLRRVDAALFGDVRDEVADRAERGAVERVVLDDHLTLMLPAALEVC